MCCSGHNGVYRAGVVKVDEIILDTGAGRSIVHSRMAPSWKVTTPTWSVDGDAIRHPLARVNNSSRRVAIRCGSSSRKPPSSSVLFG